MGALYNTYKKQKDAEALLVAAGVIIEIPLTPSQAVIDELVAEKAALQGRIDQFTNPTSEQLEQFWNMYNGVNQMQLQKEQLQSLIDELEGM